MTKVVDKNQIRDKYTGLTIARYEIITDRYNEFVQRLDKLDQEPTKVFDPLGKKSLDELELIREVSKDLQEKKNEDIRRQAQIKAEAAEAPKENAENEEEKKSEEK